MKNYKEEITLITNSRGCDIIDTVKGCYAGALYDGKGCYADCYAKNIADRYGFNFTNLKLRKFTTETSQLMLVGFKDQDHANKIVKSIKESKMPFVRIGEMGDPSYAWEHAIDVCEQISSCGKPIVIITKHWKPFPQELIERASKLNLCINTSVSALDNPEEIEYRLEQFNRAKSFCKSVLRIVSCNFNKEHADGLDRHLIQEELFKNHPHIDTVFRPSKKNPFVVNKIILVERIKFLRADVLASVKNKNTYFGMCQTCPDMCGASLKI